MNILFIHYGTTGNAKIAPVDYFPVILTEMGHHVSIVAKAGGKSNELIQAGVHVFEAAGAFSLIPTIIKAAKLFTPQIVHVFIHFGCGLYPFLLRLGSKPLFVLDVQSPLLHRGITRHLIRLKNRLEILGYDEVVSVSVDTAPTAIGNSRPVHAVPIGADLNAIPYKERPDTHSPPLRTIYAGSLRRLRNIPRLVQAFSIAAKELPITLDIYGEGDDKESIMRMIHETGCGNIVRLLGKIPRADLFARLNDYDLALAYVPKLLYDPAPPLKTIEYLANGLPTVATNTSGNSLIITNKENGILVDDDPTSVAKGIIQLAGDTELQRRISRKTRLSVAAYDWKRIVEDKLLPVYRINEER